MGTTGYHETSVPNYHFTLRNIPEERRSRLRRGRRLKSYIRFGHHRNHTDSSQQNQQQYFGGNRHFYILEKKM